MAEETNIQKVIRDAVFETIKRNGIYIVIEPVAINLHLMFHNFIETLCKKCQEVMEDGNRADSQVANLTMLLFQSMQIEVGEITNYVKDMISQSFAVDTPQLVFKIPHRADASHANMFPKRSEAKRMRLDQEEEREREEKDCSSIGNHNETAEKLVKEEAVMEE